MERKTGTGDSSPSHENADVAFLEFLHLRSEQPDLTLERFCQDRPELGPTLQRMGRLWSFLEERDAIGSGKADGSLRALDPGSGEGASSIQTLVEELARPRGSDAYRVLDRLAQGGMSDILRVWDERLRRVVVMKLLPRELAGPPVTASQRRHATRLIEEAQVTAQLQHPSILSVHDVGVDATGRLFFTMPLVKGRHLGEIIDLVHQGEEGWTLGRVLAVVQRLCEALAYAHSKGVIHRDLKPSNIMVGRFGETYLMDWGLAKVLRPDAMPGSESREVVDGSLVIDSVRRRIANDTPTSSVLTVDGAVVGTPAYMSPEQAAGHSDELGPRSDVYSVGAILYQLLTSRRPYARSGSTPSAEELIHQVCTEPPVSIERIAPRVPADLVAVCEKAMARDPRDRYGDILEMANDLQAHLDGRVVKAFRGGPVYELGRWVRRNRSAALAAGIALLGVIAGLTAVATVERRHRRILEVSESELREANRSLEAARRAERLRVEELRRSVYLNQIARAEQALQESEFGVMARILAGCDEDLRRWEWHFLEASSRPWVRRFSGHTEKVIELLLLPDGKRFVSGDADCTVRIFDLETGECEHLLSGHTRYIDSLDVTEDGRVILSASRDGTLRFWDADSGELLHPLVPQVGQSVKAIFLPDQSLIAVCGDLNVIQIWRWRSCELLTTLRGHPDCVKQLVVSPDRSALVSTGRNGHLRVWDLATWETIRTLELGAQASRQIRFLEDGRRVLMPLTELDYRGQPGPANARCHVLDLETGKVERVFSLPSLFYGAAVLSPDEKILATEDGTQLALLDFQTGEEIGVLPGHEQGVKYFLWLDNRRLLVSDGVGGIMLWDLDHTSVHRDLDADSSCITAAVSPSGELIATGHEGGSILLRAPSGEPPFLRIESGQGAVWRLLFSPDGRSLLSSGQNGTFCLWDPATGAEIRRVVQRRPARPRMSPRGDRVITLDEAGVGFWKLPDWTGLRGKDLGAAFSASISPDGTTVVVSHSIFVALWDVESARPIRQSEADPEGRRIVSLAYSSDGRSIAAGRFNGEISILDSTSLEVLSGFDGRHETEEVSDVMWLDGDERLASVGFDGKLRLWDTRTGRGILALPATDWKGIRISASSDGRVLACPGPNGKARVWQLSGGEE